VPVDGHLQLRRSWPIGQSSKFTMPGVGDGRIYVGTRDGHVLGFGAPVAAPVRGQATTFPATTVGATRTKDVVLTIAGGVHMSSVTASPAGTFAVSGSVPGVPGDLADGQTLTIPVAFSPSSPGVIGGTLTATTDKGTFTFSLTGTAQADGPLLSAWPPLVSFGGVVVGKDHAGAVSLGNAGSAPLTITGITLPGAPFHVTDAPAVGDVIDPQGSVTVGVSYAPTAVGDDHDDLVVQTTGGDKTIGLSGIGSLGPALTLTPASGWAFGDVPLGESAEASVVVANTGDSPMSIAKSKPPGGDALTIVSGLDEGTTIAPGQRRTVTIRFTPTALGPLATAWTLNAGDPSGLHDVPVTGTGVPPRGVGGTDAPAPGAGAGAGAGPGSAQAGFLGAQGPILPPRARAALSVTRLLPSRDGRRLTIRGRVARAARGPVAITLTARVGHKTYTVVTGARLAGRSTYAFTVVVPKAMKKWTRLKALVRFGGSATVQPGAGVLVLVRSR
jgi:iron transport multicopper oxidase